MLLTFLKTLGHVFSPILLMIIGGALLQATKKLDTRPLATLSLYVLTPALIFQTLYEAHITSGEVYRITAFTLLNLVVAWLLAFLFTRLLRLRADQAAGLSLVSCFTNSVNYGLPLISLAFGQKGLDDASVFVILQIIVVNTCGVFLAARSHFSIFDAFKKIFTLPAVYAAMLAILVRLVGGTVPGPFDTGIHMMSAAYTPVVLSILGAQMMRIARGREKETPDLSAGTQNKALFAGLVIRFLLGPAAAGVLLVLLGIHGMLFSVLLLLASMPSAVNAVILAEEFDAAPAFVSRTILVTTLASFVFLPLLLKFLM